MAFKINQNTKGDVTEISRAWSDKLKAGIGATIMMAGMASTPVHAEQIISPTGNIFTQSNNPIDKTHQKEYNNSVFITASLRDGKDNDFIIMSGSGTIIADSKDEQGHNVILTAAHIAGHPFESKMSNYSCNDGKTICYAYDSNGNPLGQLTEKATSNDVNNRESEVGDHIRNDVSTFSISPINDKYDQIEGAEIAPNLPDNIMKSQIKKDIINQDGTTSTIGPDHGLSGGGVFDKKGRLISVVSFYSKCIKNDDGSISPNTTQVKGNVKENGNSIVEYLADKGQIQGLSHNNQKIFAKILQNDERGGEGLLFFPKINNPQIMASLGNAGKQVRGILEPDNQKISTVGFPSGSAQEYSSRLDGEKIFNNDLEAKVFKEQDQDGKDVIIRNTPIPGMESSLF